MSTRENIRLIARAPSSGQMVNFKENYNFPRFQGFSGGGGGGGRGGVTVLTFDFQSC